MSAIFLLPVCLQYWPKKYTTRVDHNGDNFHQVRSWYDHPLPSYSVFVCWYVTWPCDLDLWPLTINTWSTWRVTWPTSPPSMNTLRLSVFSYELKRFPLVIIESAYAATARAPNHVTRELVVKNNYILGMLDPDLPIHYATLVALRWKW